MKRCVSAGMWNRSTCYPSVQHVKAFLAVMVGLLRVLRIRCRSARNCALHSAVQIGVIAGVGSDNIFKELSVHFRCVFLTNLVLVVSVIINMKPSTNYNTQCGTIPHVSGDFLPIHIGFLDYRYTLFVSRYLSDKQTVPGHSRSQGRFSPVNY